MWQKVWGGRVNIDGKDNGEEGGDGLLDGLRDYRFLSIGLCNRVFEQHKLEKYN